MSELLVMFIFFGAIYLCKLTYDLEVYGYNPPPKYRRGLQCPKCKGYGFSDCLLSMPPQYLFTCHCGFNLIHYERKNPREDVTQQELDDYFHAR